MATRPRIRFITNTELAVTTQDGKTENRVFTFGKIYGVFKIVNYDDGYSDIHLEGGSVIKGIKASDAVEVMGDVEVENVNTETPEPEPEPEEVAEEEETKRKWPSW